MKKTMVAFVMAAAIAMIVACGDSKPEPKAPDTTAPAASASAATTEAPAASAAPSAAPPPAETAAAADAGAPAKPPVVIGETKDECTPVGVDFEKRARPKLKECYAEGKKKTGNPNLMGTVKIKITVDLKGKIKKTQVVEKTLPDSVADCMLKAVKGTPFPEVDKCWDSTLTIPVTFPTPP